MQANISVILQKLQEGWEKRIPQYILNDRQEILKKFVVRLNKEREGTGYGPLRAAFIASRMYQSGLNTDYLLCWFYGYCAEAQSFTRTWWWALRSDEDNAKSKVRNSTYPPAIPKNVSHKIKTRI